jgi:hypothetical protein
MKGVAYRMQDKFALAQVELEIALAVAPTDASLLHERQILMTKKAAYRVKSKELGAAMFQTQRKEMDPIQARRS